MHEDDTRSTIERLRSSLALLAFGVGTLGFLVAIDRPEWFHLRPATGTAAAMSNAASGEAPATARAPDRSQPPARPRDDS